MCPNTDSALSSSPPVPEVDESSICFDCRQNNLPQAFSSSLNLCRKEGNPSRFLSKSDYLSTYREPHPDVIFVNMNEESLDMGRLHHKSRPAHGVSCGICRLLSYAWPDNLGSPHHLVATWHDPGSQFYSERFPIGLGNDQNLIVGGVNWMKVQTSPPGKTKMTACIVEAPIESLATLRNPHIDFSILKSWIETCSSHEGICSKNSEISEMDGMKLINVETREIEDALGLNVRYAALSYVFKDHKEQFSTTEEQSSKPYQMPSRPPQTISDSLEVTKKLGLRYLWIDRYCIDQTDESKKRNQIGKLHLIFGKAHVTIVAAAGHGPEYGIPGVSTARPRLGQPHAIIKGRLFAAVRRLPQRDIKESRWSTRAWTYQEEILSRRLLYFTNSQVLFRCTQKNLVGVEEPIRNFADVASSRSLVGMHSKSSMRRRNSGPISVDHYVQEISRRELSFESDRVNTIAGIFGALQDERKLTGHLYGIPLFTVHCRNDEASKRGLLDGLSWELINSPCERRTEFPSWSWAGWKGACCYGFGGSYPVDDIQIKIELESSQTISIQDIHKLARVDSSPSPVSRHIHIEAPVIHCRIIRDGKGCKMVSVEGHVYYDTNLKVKIDKTISASSEHTLSVASEDYIGLYFPTPGGFVVIFIEEHEGFFERIGIWNHFVGKLPFETVVELENGFLKPYGCSSSLGGSVLEKAVKLRKRKIRLG